MPRMRDLSMLAQTYMAYRRGAEICSYPPTRVWVEPTSHCNLRCSFCGNRLLPKEQRGFMDFDLFRKLVDEAAGSIRQFNMFHRGESLLHPQIGEMIRYAASRGLRTRIHTNGTLLNPDLSRSLVESRLDVLSFSFDGYDREMYEANRPNASFDRVLSNMLGFLAVKKEMGADTPFVALELMELAGGPAGEIRRKRRKFLRRFAGLPLDKFIIRRPHNWAGLVDTGSAGESPGRKRVPCPLLWHALVVFWDGRILPCPQDVFGSLQLGDARSRRLLDVWNGDEIRSLRREMADPASLERRPCVDCDRILRATIAGVPTDYLGRFLSETVFSSGWLSRLLPH